MPRAGNCLSLVGFHGGRCSRDPNLNLHCMGSKKKSRQDSSSLTELDRVASGTNLPDSIKVGYLRCKVRPYIPSPLRCFKCQKFGHSKASCRGKQTCVHCSSLDHSDVNCILEPKCSNCHQPHPSSSRSCPQWQIEKKIQQTKTERNISYTEAKKLLGLQSHPTYAQITKSLISTAETQTDEKLTNVYVPSLTLLKASNPKQQCSKMTFGTGSNDLSNFTTGKKKKANKPSTSVTVTENKTNSVVASKFWKTSHLQVSNPVSVQVSNSPKSKANAEGVTLDNRTLPSAATTEPEPMTTDNVSIHSSDNETESDNAIEYNPHETIDETPSVLQQEPLTSTTVADKTAFKQRVKKCPVRWVDFKEFYNEQELSTPVHNKYLKKHQIKRLQ
ncbi:hypothetical protein AVEN_126202-1 [Araneus ventricosus]|uniref:CCHC-type domain-containing protein n=1 Tax=Araneus ventricosus TaxID=182803 RepID=A0A4Y2ITG2_ARAVE|nr:hypothetical protein AVEN_126202-1 [Araneus ventricosus]